MIAMGPDAYDRYAVAVDQVIKRDGVYYAYYHANAHDPWQKDWTTNIARSTRPGPLGEVPRQPPDRQRLVEQRPGPGRRPDTGSTPCTRRSGRSSRRSESVRLSP